MRIYVAGRFGRYERCRALMDDLASAGHEITQDWTRGEHFDEDGHPRTEDENIPREQQAALARGALDGVARAELVVVIADEPLCGALIEFGCAVAHGVPVWVIAPWRWSVFWTHPLVTVWADENAARDRLLKVAS